MEEAPTRAFSWLKAPMPILYDFWVSVPISGLLTVGSL